MLVAPVGSARPASLVCKLPAALWRYRRYAVDNRPWCGPGYPAAAYIYSEDRKGVHPAEHLKGYSGLLQVDGYAGFADLVDNPAGEPPQLAFCVAHARRKFYDVFVATKSPIAEEALQRIAALYLIESDVRGKPATERQRVRDRESRPLVEAMYVWLKEQLGRIPGGSGLPQAIRYALNHWRGLTLFLDDGRLELDSNTVERSIRPITITRKNALFAGNNQGGENWACLASLIETALCRARHRQVYAARRTMPNALVFPRNGHDLDMIGSA